jgi:hypothetical protein
LQRKIGMDYEQVSYEVRDYIGLLTLDRLEANDPAEARTQFRAAPRFALSRFRQPRDPQADPLSSRAGRCGKSAGVRRLRRDDRPRSL